MASVKQDFEQFVAWLHQPERRVPANVRRLANIVLNNLDTLVQTTRYRSQRSIYLTEILRPALLFASDIPPAPPMAIENAAWPWRQLRHLTLGPFRGFRVAEEFDLQKRIILFYGPNGSGKTSFCEGLEYALLGGVEEAENKRIEPRLYLANLHEDRFSPPVLKASDHHNNEVDVVANAEAYRFCFIEKNRIDAFSRIAARSAGQRSELIATLFGMDRFSDFVSHFNESIDAQLTLDPIKARSLTARREALEADQAIVVGDDAAQAALDAEEATLASDYAAEMIYVDLKQLLGSEDNPGRLKELEDILNVLPPAVIGLTRNELRQAFETAQDKNDQVKQIKAALVERSAQVSFKDLYTSVLALQELEGEHCPACDTPLIGLRSVITNPYEKAQAGLAQLRDLSTLQENLEVLQRELETASRALRKMMADMNGFILAHLEQETDVGRYLAGLPPEPVGVWWGAIILDQAAAPETVSLEQLFAIVDRVEAQDTAVALMHLERERNIEERDRLNEFRLRVQAQDIKRRQHLQSVAAARDRIVAFNEINADFIEQVAQEARDIERATPIKIAYDRFLLEIRRYREQLPAGLMAGLNQMAMNLYNEFNRNDLDADKLAELHLPLTGDDKINVVFRGRPEIRVDALHVLSEGHIRCLGLAILLAKAKSIESPLVVFDDAINAIDHDHRGGIREAIFENDNFLDMQLIVTCHSNEFIKDIEQHLPQRQRGQCSVILFRHHGGDYQPQVTRNVPIRNYIDQARAAKDLLNDRDALSASRKALEMLTEKTWRWLASHEHGVLTLPIPGIGVPPGLRNVCEALLRKLRDAVNFNHVSKNQLVTAYSAILGIPEGNLVWTYLNKGIHEEANRDDFDGEVVEVLVQTLQSMDAIELRPRR